ncbi:MAG TPA: hypothetical protein VLH16_01820 [Bacteroidales bacterium]|nr:hypothetical protein [Bacteroidales bacterium]
MSLFHGLFWGIALIILGAGLIARYYFQFQFPWLRILVAFMFIYAGLWFLLWPRFAQQGNALVIFSEGRMSYDPTQDHYLVLFGNAVVDLTLAAPEKIEKIRLTCIFGQMKVKLKPDANFIIKSSSAFGEYIGPDGNSMSFGERRYSPLGYDFSEPSLHIEASVVFGSMKVTYD